MKNRSLFILTMGIGLLFQSTATAAPFLFETGKLVPSDEPEPAFNQFGSSVDVSGQYLAIGAFGDGSANVTGAVYVFKQSGNGWVEHTKLIGSGVTFERQLGRSVAIDGEWIVAGGPKITTFINPGDGKVYLFRLDGDTWSEHTVILSPDPENDLYFGKSVDISGNLMVASSGGFDGAPGRVYLYRFDGTNWLEETTLFALPGADRPSLGGSVAIENNVIVAASTGDDGNGETIGVVDIFRYNGTSWIEETKLTASDNSTSVTMGTSLSMDGNDLVVGAVRDDHAGPFSGSAFVFHYDGQSWTQQDKIIASDASIEDWFGFSVAIAGDDIVVGANHHNLTCTEQEQCVFGMAYLFHRSGNQWVEQYRLSASNHETFDMLGHSVAMNQDQIFSGAVSNGKVFTYLIPPPIPTLSNWGLLILLLLLVITGTVYLRKHARLLACVSIFILPAIVIARTPDLTIPHHPEHLLVRFVPGTSAQDRMNIHAGINASHLKDYRFVDGLTLVKVPAANLENALNHYLSNPNVLYAEPDYYYESFTAPDDPEFANQWGLHNTGTDHHWRCGCR